MGRSTRILDRKRQRTLLNHRYRFDCFDDLIALLRVTRDENHGSCARDNYLVIPGWRRIHTLRGQIPFDLFLVQLEVD